MMYRLWIPLVFAFLTAIIPGCSVDTCRNEEVCCLDGYVMSNDGRPVRGVKVYGFADVPEASLHQTAYLAEPHAEGHDDATYSSDLDGIDDIPLPLPTCSTRTDAYGYYRMSIGYGVKEFVVVPGKEGCSFSPRSRFWRPGDTLDGYDFLAYCGEGYLVDGHVWGREGPGQPIPGVSLYITESDGSRWDYTLTDEEGYYVFYDLYPVFDYEIAPFSYCPEYEPASRVIERPDRDYHDQDFTLVTPELVYIRGLVTDPYGAPLEGVTIEFRYRAPHGRDADAPYPLSEAAQLSVETDVEGRYSIHTPACLYIEVRPSEPGCFPVPSLRSYGPANDIDGQDFTLYCEEGYTISGRLMNEYEEPIPNQPVDILGPDLGQFEVRSDAAGYYEFTGLPWEHDYQVKPERGPIECDWVPTRREYQNLDRDYADQNFVLSCSR